MISARAVVLQDLEPRTLAGSQSAKSALSRSAVAVLDAARACAACYVVLHHVAEAHGYAHGLGTIFRFGQEAVLIFFLLSGFVIFANEHKRALSPRGYYLRRLRRIYPPLLCALLLSTLIAVANGDFTSRFRWTELLGTMFSLQDISFLKPGVIVNPYLGNAPLWSLSYEVAFYLTFPAVLLLWKNARWAVNHVVGAVCCSFYVWFALAPNHFALVGAYFLVWWCGAMAAEAYLRGARSVTAMLDSYLWLILLCVIAGIVVVKVGYTEFGRYPSLPLRHFAMAALLLGLLFGPVGQLGARLAYGCRRLFAPVASISYGLYVLHYPLLVQWTPAATGAGLAVAGVLLLTLAWLVERQLTRVLPRAPRA